MRVILFLVIITILFIPTLAFSDATPSSESVTVTTYYPAPYGEYKEVSAYKLRLGGAPAPQNNGNVTFLPQAGDPDSKTGAFTNGQTGEVAYSSTKNAFYYYDGSKWAGLGGTGTGPGSWVCQNKQAAHPQYQAVSLYCDSGYKLIVGSCGGSSEGSYFRGWPLSNGWHCPWRNGG